MSSQAAIPTAFITRRLHSLTGFFLVLFLFQHLLVNSQAALILGDNGKGFIEAVNSIQSLPYLPVLEIIFLGVPFAIHAVWGVYYIFTAKYNSLPSNGSKPALPEYPRNHAYTWQRITSWIILVGLIGHVVHMRFVEYPASADRLGDRYYMTRLSLDEGLYTLAPRLNVQLYGNEDILKEKESLKVLDTQQPLSENLISKQKLEEQEKRQKKEWIAALEERPLREGDVIAVSDNFGTAEVLMVRDAFKSLWVQILYTIFLLASVFHAFNGLWTFLITWGIILTATSQWWMQRISWSLLLLTAFFGLAAIWATYIWNLYT